MKVYLSLAAIALLVLVGCGSGTTEKVAEQAAAHAEQAQAAVEEAAAEVQQAVYEAGQEVTLTGSLGCGHCSFQKTDDCAAAMQTEDGLVVILDVDQENELFTKRTDGGTVTVEGKIVDAGDPPHVEVSTYNLGS